MKTPLYNLELGKCVWKCFFSTVPAPGIMEVYSYAVEEFKMKTPRKAAPYSPTTSSFMVILQKNLLY